MSAILGLDTAAMLWSHPPNERSGRHLLVMMHGYGGVEQDLAQNFGHLPAELVAVSVRAPVLVDGRWCWGNLDLDGLETFHAAARGVLRWLDGLSGFTSIGLLGFSQGGAMALQLLRSDARRFAYAVQLSGFLAGPDSDGDAQLALIRPPVFSGHGGMDDVIPVEEAERVSAWLPQHTTPTERHYPELGHAVSDEVIRDVLRFIRDNVPADQRG